MIKLEDITLEKKALINKYLSRKCSQNSEFTFTNLFMWRKSYDMKYAIINDMLCIMPQHGGGPRSATFPIGINGDIRPVIEKLLEYFNETKQTPLIRLYDDESVGLLIKAFPGKFLITEDVNYFDYVYNVCDLINLSGKKYHAKKNHINKFDKLYNWTYERITPDIIPECLQLFDTWWKNKSEEIDGIDEEYEAVHELFSNWDKLDVTGGCLRVDGNMAAFSVGEPLCGRMAVIHFEHADTNYDGSFAMINREFLKHEWSEFEFVNREEDMGQPGMRRAKESYRPVRMVKKYVATLL